MLYYNVTTGSAGKDNKHVLIIRQVFKRLQGNKKEGGKGRNRRGKNDEMFHERMMKRFTSERERSAKFTWQRYINKSKYKKYTDK